MAEIVLSIIGVEGQRLAGIQVGKMIGKQVCESIRSSFKTDMIEKYKELSTAATKNILGNPEDLKKLTTALSKTFDGMVIDKFVLKTNDSNLKKGGMLGRLIGGVDGEETQPAATDPPADAKADSTNVAENTAKKTADDAAKNLTGSLPQIPDTGALGSALTGALPGAGAIPGADALSGIDLNNPIDALPGAALIKSTIQGLKPDEGVVPGYLVDALNETVVKEQMIKGFEQFITELTENNSNDLKKMFLDVLKEQINEKFRSKEGDKIFRETIINVIQEKCITQCDPETGKCENKIPVAEAVAVPPETDTKKEADTKKEEVPPVADAKVVPTEEAEAEEKKDGTPIPEATKVTGGKSNKRSTRKILKLTTKEN